MGGAARRGERTAEAPRVYLRTFGCGEMRVEAREAAEALARRGFAVHEPGAVSDALVVATPADAAALRGASAVVAFGCALSGHAERRLLGAFREAARRRAPGAPFVVAGCSARYPHSLAPLRRAERAGTPAALLAVLQARLGRAGPPRPSPPPPDGVEPIRVADGCSKRCTYCITPHLRALHRVPLDRVLEQVRRAAAAGCRAVEFGSPCPSEWHDPGRPETGFAELLQRCGDGAGPKVVRLEVHPADLDDRVIAALAGPGIERRLSLPIQSGSDRILRRMGRRYDAARVERLLERLRRRVPGLAISTDFIAGFPGETPADLEATVRLLRRGDFDAVGVYLYSPRPGTPAARWEAVPAAEAERRCRLLVEAWADGRVCTVRLVRGAHGPRGFLDLLHAYPVELPARLPPGSVLRLRIRVDGRGRLVGEIPHPPRDAR